MKRGPNKLSSFDDLRVRRLRLAPRKIQRMTDSTCFVIPEILLGEVFDWKIQTPTASTKSRAKAIEKISRFCGPKLQKPQLAILWKRCEFEFSNQKPLQIKFPG